MIYLDNAATSWPKPKEVLHAMGDFIEYSGGNPGRSGHRLSISAARIVYNAREAVAELFHAPDPLKVIFTSNVTYALNLAICGLLKPGDHVVTSSIEHNSVMRPLRALEKEGIRLTVVQCGTEGLLDLEAFRAAITPGTRLVVVTHASNVMGTIMPIKKIATIAHKAGALLLVDTAQTAGILPIDQPAMGIDLLAFTGHKGLYGPTGTGGLVIGERVDPSELRPMVRGGTGSRSEYEEQPDMLPDKYESGTGNSVGIAGLGAGIHWIQTIGVESIQARERELSELLLSGLQNISGITRYGPADSREMTAVVSCTVAGQRVSQVGLRLDEEFGILTRVGLHCAPSAHKTVGTFPEGTIRLAPGIFTSPDDIRAVIAAFENIAVHHD
ncbi:MAG: aminotransferase class V-fold PLP-dependent enzyme [Anaerolineales bacterium]|jgi:cysteine desulfurase family protein